MIWLCQPMLNPVRSAEQIEHMGFATSRSGDIDVEVADRVPLERLLASCLAFDGRKPADLVDAEVRTEEGKLHLFVAIDPHIEVCFRSTPLNGSLADHRTGCRWPLDDCLYALQATIPHLTRSSLHCLFQRAAVKNLSHRACRNIGSAWLIP